ncbi:unnamed protein product [Urochloa decumbens]|uniref:non-specific serine/threonine protein kinase n=1 Tax=Urochloa decumbens TaxID=240449 RepID=A0ABC8VPX4_9POAL
MRKHSKPRTMAAKPWLLLLSLAAGATAGVLQARAQPDSIGFISIDCGLPGTAGYVDNTTKLWTVPDAGFTDTGSNHNISAEYTTQVPSQRYHNVRSFPDGARNCYTLSSLVAGLKYLIRAAFIYGNYDGLGLLPIFDLYIGVNFWGTVNVSSPDGYVVMEAIVVVPDDFVQVCMVNTGTGTPFISLLDLRPLKNLLYPQVNAMQGLVLLGRTNFAPGTEGVRYPDDPHDRVWAPWIDAAAFDVISTTNKVLNIEDDLFDAPSKVMQTAITPLNATKPIYFYWDSKPQLRDPTPQYVAVMYFSDLQLLPNNSVREFYVNVNGELWSPGGITPDYLRSNAVYSEVPFRASARYNVIINATANSTLPPFINAFEVFSIISTTNPTTDSQDVSAITAIKAKYGVQKNWMGDPCGPKNLAWNGLTCSYGVSIPPKITGVNISFSGLSGDISSSFANLRTVRYLNLSHNSLTGSIPDIISQLPSLTVLDLTGNQLSGSIPPGLLKRTQDGYLNLQYGNNPDLCTNADSCKPPKGKSKHAIYIAVPVVLVVVIGLLAALFFCFMRRRKKGSTTSTVKPENETPASDVPRGDAHTQSSLQLENRRFTYSELVVITNNFERLLGQGGFGEVYSGSLPDGTRVAVKLRSQTSNPDDRQFLAEAQILTRIHHKNLVSMIGYCKDGQHMALVFEYMSEGTLQEQIVGNRSDRRRLTWRQRLRMALDSAQGLEYLHKGCNPPLIHRDVKATNILLNEKLEAKIADFGLSKAFGHASGTQVGTSSLVVVGTFGYMDPEYYKTQTATTKSDVYSFGIVLLELVTGKPAILHDPEPTNIADWARRRMARGNIEGVVDARMQGNYDVNSVWKVAEIALKCTVQASSERPSMTDVVGKLQECLQLEELRTGDAATGSFYTGTSRDPNSGYNANSAATTASEMEHDIGWESRMDTGPVAR